MFPGYADDLADVELALRVEEKQGEEVHPDL
jgi:hypothetical protein